MEPGADASLGESNTMASPQTVTDFVCPVCRAVLEPEQGHAATQCPSCGWTGEVYLFRPIELDPEQAVDALPEDATCVHHASKRAVAACAGTGDFICALCAIELDGEVYSAQYLNAGGKKKVSKSFDRYLPRPDREVGMAIFLSLLIWCLFVVTLPYAIHRFYKMCRLRRENELYARLVGPVTVGILAVLLVLVALIDVGVIVSLSRR
jgi:hypothetical protein